MPLVDLPPPVDPGGLGDRETPRRWVAAEPRPEPADRYDGAEEAEPT